MPLIDLAALPRPPRPPRPHGPHRSLPTPRLALAALRLGAALLFPFLLTACANLQAIETYAESAAELTSATEAAQRWRDSETHLGAWRLEGDVCPIGRTGRLPQARFDQAFEQIAQVHQAMGRYFTTLAALAGDQVPPRSGPANRSAIGSLEALQASGVEVSERDERAVKALLSLVDSLETLYRERQLRAVMNGSQEDVAQVLALMDRLAQAYAQDLRGEGIQAVGFVRCEIGQSDLSDKYLGRRELQRVRQHYEAAQAALSRYQLALRQLAADHARIRDALNMDRDSMTRSLKAIARTARDLDRARDAIAAR
ncbi:hypothetical protein [Roseateles amylovorans]|uniref:DUF3829 domain-containing protein n=1 Tax=Roseateles amylovorans TaxID=2978473 RepID=A0ABY6AYX9_9BURK|nr:hypothetical protein [Roseateles amylovorans]UXH77790.1 hypothetical protein N4261_22895 [Roseateles amylovorans]